MEPAKENSSILPLLWSMSEANTDEERYDAVTEKLGKLVHKEARFIIEMAKPSVDDIDRLSNQERNNYSELTHLIDECNEQLDNRLEKDPLDSDSKKLKKELADQLQKVKSLHQIFLREIHFEPITKTAEDVVSYRPKAEGDMVGPSVFIDLQQLSDPATPIELCLEVYQSLVESLPSYDLSKFTILAAKVELLHMHLEKKDTQKKHEPKLSELHARFEKQKLQIEQSLIKKEEEADPSWKIELEKDRLQDTMEELKRLIQKSDRIKQGVLKTRFTKENKLSWKQLMVLAHSLELQEKLQRTHYVFNHGQSASLMLVNLVHRELKRWFEPQRYESFRVLRHDVALEHMERDQYTIQWIQKEIRDKGLRDTHFRRELICADCYLESTEYSESAISYFIGEYKPSLQMQSGESSPTITANLIEPALKSYFTDSRVIRIFKQKIAKMVDDRLNYTGQGNLYSICVPKEKFEEACYYSRRLGWPSENELNPKELNKLQAGKLSDHLKLDGYIYPTPPQIRLLSHKIKREEGFHVILNSTLTDEGLQKLENMIHDLIAQAVLGFPFQPTKQ